MLWRLLTAEMAPSPWSIIAADEQSVCHGAPLQVAKQINIILINIFINIIYFENSRPSETIIASENKFHT